MRILYLVHQFFPEFPTGTERFVLDLAGAMQRGGHRVKVLTWRRGGGATPTVKRHGTPASNYIHQKLSVTALEHSGKPWESIFRARRAPHLERLADEILAEGRYDLLHVGHPMHMNPFILAAARKRLPYLVTLTDYFAICHRSSLTDPRHEPCPGPRQGRRCAQECPQPGLTARAFAARIAAAGLLLSRATAVVSPSRYLARRIREEFPNLKIKLIRYGVSLSGASAERGSYTKESKLTFGYLGSLTPHKGIHVLIRAFRKLQNPDCRLAIHGFPVDKDYLLDLLALAHGDGRISFHGRYDSRRELLSILSGLDAICVPSVWPDNYPLVILEALACSIPVIASRVGAVPEAVRDGVTGFLFKAGDSQDLRRAMQRLADHPETLNALRRNIRPVRSVEEQAVEYERLYHAALRRARSDRGQIC